jgi:D-glycero-D-manno-heptose 1,7-bisphosphate phosphatase
VSRAAVFLDRDGVLNAVRLREGHPHPPRSVDDVVILPGVKDAIDVLRAAGLLSIVVTNQPDIARGSIKSEAVDAINHRVRAETGVDAIMVCPHDDADGCECRKPLPGLILRAAAQFDVDLGRSVLVGDRWRDIDAGRAAAVATVFVDRGYAERPAIGACLVVDELASAVPWIIERTTGRAP